MRKFLMLAAVPMVALFGVANAKADGPYPYPGGRAPRNQPHENQRNPQLGLADNICDCFDVHRMHGKHSRRRKGSTSWHYQRGETIDRGRENSV